MKIAVVLEPCEEGGFTAHVPTLPGCISEGETVEEALANIREAFEILLEPVDDDLTVGTDVEVKSLELDWIGSEENSPSLDLDQEPREVSGHPSQPSSESPRFGRPARVIGPDD